MERFFDVIFSLIAIFFLLPIFILIVAILKFTGEGEVLFLQNRIGKGGGAFKLIKFATMLKASPSLGTGTITVKDDFRILPFGGILRTTKLNELPQLFNVLKGDMSLIGPRPLTEQTYTVYPKTTQNIISQVRPGLSGVGSIIFRNEEELMSGTAATVDFYASVIAPYKGKLEEWFVTNRSLKLYFITIFLTVYVVIFPKSRAPWRILKKLPKPPRILMSIYK